jgi:hypothetical protein
VAWRSRSRNDTDGVDDMDDVDDVVAVGRHVAIWRLAGSASA